VCAFNAPRAGFGENKFRDAKTVAMPMADECGKGMRYVDCRTPAAA
jgi:hypothetical protein